MPIKINGTNTAASPSITGDDTDTGIVYGSDQIDFSTGGSSKVTLNGSNLGIGTSSPTGGKLHIAHGNELGLFTSGPYNFQAKFESTDAEAAIVIEDSNSTNDGNRIGVITDDMTFITGGTERVRINSAGNVGIGTSSITANTNYNTLQIQGQSGSGGAIIRMQTTDGSTSKAMIIADTAGLELRQETDHQIVFSTNNTARMNLSTKGRISSLLTDVDSVGVIHKRSAGSNSHNYFEIRSGGSTPTSGGTLQFAIETDGDVKNTNNSYSSLSDIKLKENIVDAKSQWDDIKALKIRNYNFKSELDYGTYTQIGLIAQEVEETSPGLVVDNIDRDDEGKDLGTVTKTLRYSVLHIKALKALQEAMAKIETLETKVAVLEAK